MAHLLSIETSTLDELKSWSNASQNKNFSILRQNINSGRCCSVCMHPGDKQSHEKNGCEECGTAPGEKCYMVTKDERFRRFVREKALSMTEPFAGWDIIKEYYNPNRGIIPKELTLTSSYHLNIPNVDDVLRSSLVVRGQSLACSRDHLRNTLPKLIVRLALIKRYQEQRMHDIDTDSHCKREPMYEILPIKIIKSVSHETIECFETSWVVNDIKCTTFEWQTILKYVYPNLIVRFEESERSKKQRAIAQFRNTMFLGENAKQRKRRRRNRKRSFDHDVVKLNEDTLYPEATLHGEDSVALMRFMPKPSKTKFTYKEDKNSFTENDHLKGLDTFFQTKQRMNRKRIKLHPKNAKVMIEKYTWK